MQLNKKLGLHRQCKHNAKWSFQKWFAPLRQRDICLDKWLSWYGFKFFRSSSVPTYEHTLGNSPLNKNHLFQDDLQILKDGILSSPKNPVIVHLDLKSLKNKINNELRILTQDIPLSYFVLSETKLDKKFPIAQFHIPGYEIRARKDRNKYGVL